MTTDAPTDVREGGEPLRVLILEDRPADATLMVHELRRAGFAPQWQRVDTEADYLDSLRPDLDVILADGVLPGFDANHAIDLVKQRGLNVPVIVVTGSLSDERAVDLIKRGASDYVLKDRPARLGPSVRQALQSRRLTDEKRRAEQERKRFFDLSVDMLCITDFEGNFRVLNPAWEEALGWSTAELMAKPYLDFVHPDDRAATAAETTRLMAGGQTLWFENRCRRKDGSYRWLSWRAVPDPDLRVIYATARDTTPWKQAEEALRGANATLQALIHSAPVAIVVTEVDGTVRVWNRSAERLFGWSDREVVGGPKPVALGERPEEFQETLRKLRGGNALTEVERRRMTRAGQPRDVLLSAAPLRGADGNLRAMIEILSDVTERKQLEAQFLQSQKMEAIGKLAGGVAHDFNNLLTVITGYGEVLLGQTTASDPNREMLQEITKAGHRAASLTGQLLAFSKKQIVAPRILDVGVVIVGTQKMLQRLIGEDIRLRVINDPDLRMIKADPGQIEQVLLNLVVNARDAMPRGGEITIESRNVQMGEGLPRPRRFVQITVTDTGVGMDAATQERIFEPFFTTKGERGTGLGLSTVQSIVRGYDGQIRVTSKPGRGTTFEVYFPVSEGPISLSKSSQGGIPLPRGSETILLAEDDESIRNFARYVLAGCGYTVLTATDGVAALRTAEAHAGRIDLLVTDVVMPHLSGRELADRFVQMRPGTRVLFLSGYTDDAVLRHGVRAAEVAFLHKPFTSSALAQKIREVLDDGGEVVS